MENTLTRREAELRIAALNLEHKKRSNEIVGRREQLSMETNSIIESLKKNYIKAKTELMGEIASIRQERCGLAFEDPQRDAYNAQIREREMKLSLIRDQLDLDINETKTAAAARRHEIDQEARKLDYEHENLKQAIMEELASEETHATPNSNPIRTKEVKVVDTVIFTPTGQRVKIIDIFIRDGVKLIEVSMKDNGYTATEQWFRSGKDE